ncbi:hypothetical protein [Bradyrhizobium sp. HKCCYLRH1062]|uniref:hypothetical protein n=1 Tax=unclassified Bradyrhizobium TaxID=2631580 RepID=UPI003EBB5708
MGGDPGIAPPAGAGRKSERRAIDATFILALIFGLRARGIASGPDEAAAAAALSKLQAEWARDELAAVLLPIFARRPGEAGEFVEVFRRLFDDQPASVLTTTTTTTLPTTPTATPRHDPPPRRRLLHELRTRTTEALQRTSGSLSRLGSYRKQALVVAGVAIMVWIFVNLDYGSQLPHCALPSACGPEDHISAPLVWLYAAASATFVVALALIAWSAYASRTHVARGPRRGPLSGSRGQVAGDGSVFRVGSIGGRADPFIGPALAIEIAEIIGYRAGEPDPSRLDARRTIAARLRGDDPSRIHFVPRRELPTVLLLLDSSSEARFWNTLPTEFADTLVARGVALDRVDFPGSFFLRRGAQWLARPELELVDSAIAAPGWTITIVFAEAHRLSERDIVVLRRMLENGPLLFLELRDPALWDERQLALQDSGAIVVPATGPHLRDGLAQLFAPDRIAAVPIAFPKSERAGAETLAQRLGDALDWAAECALIQPVSFSLAERLRLRERHTKLTPHKLAFSRLTALPGGFLGPEGLRLEAGTRRALLEHFGRRSPEQRKEVLDLVCAAIALAPAKGATAKALKRYIEAQSLLFDATPDHALREINALKEEGLIDPDPINDLIGRLRPPEYPGLAYPGGTLEPSLAAEPIRLPAEPFSAGARLQIAGFDGGYETERQRIVPAEWTVATPEVRLRLPTIDRSIPVAAFLSSGNEILYEGEVRESESVLLLLNSANATRERIALSVPGGVRRIAVAETAAVAAVWIGSNALRLLRLPETSGSGERPAPLKVDLGSWAGDFTNVTTAPLFVLDPGGSTLALRGPSGQHLRLLDTESGSLRTDDVLLESFIESLVVIDGNRVIAGMRDGRVLSVGIGGTSERFSRIASFDGVPTSLDVMRAAENSYALLVGLDNGRIIIIANDSGSPKESPPVEIARVNLKPATISVCLPVEDRAAARIEPIDNTAETKNSGISFEGVCIAVLGSGGEFDVIGLPLTPSGRVLTRQSDIVGRPGTVRLFSSMSLLHQSIGPAIDGSRVIASASGGRRLAAISGGRLVIRPLTYALKKPAEMSKAEAEPEPDAQQSVSA